MPPDTPPTVPTVPDFPDVPVQNVEGVEGDRLAELHALREGVRHLVIGMDRLRAALAHDLGLGLHALTALGHIFAQGGIAPKDLADQLGVTRGSATGIVDRLVAAGLVTRVAHPTDGRSVSVRLTPAGARARAYAVAVLDHALAEACAHTATTEIRGLTALLTTTSDQIDRIDRVERIERIGRVGRVGRVDCGVTGRASLRPATGNATTTTSGVDHAPTPTPTSSSSLTRVER